VPRGSRYGSRTFEEDLAAAEKHVWADWEQARVFAHKGLVGKGREQAVAKFLVDHLPTRFGVATGEAIDFLDNRTSQLDVIVYDRSSNTPLAGSAGGGNELLPAEALLAVIEVKSVLNSHELRACLKAAGRLRKLKPYKSKFIDARTSGKAATDGMPRCMFTVFAYQTDLVEATWPKSEWTRLLALAKEENTDPAMIDRVLILNRGLINPLRRTARSKSGSGGDVLLEWFLHLTNFLRREAPRRKGVDWQQYAAKYHPGWQRLD
jgi:hypothetical protein